jgi:hypothetical protein
MALRMATRQLVPNATRDCAAGMDTAASAARCAGKVAAMYSHHWRFGTKSNVQNRMMLGGQNGAKIRSDNVPTANAACAPR